MSCCFAEWLKLCEIASELITTAKDGPTLLLLQVLLWLVLQLSSVLPPPSCCANVLLHHHSLLHTSNCGPSTDAAQPLL
jgi:hypothetical protein